MARLKNTKDQRGLKFDQIIVELVQLFWIGVDWDQTVMHIIPSQHCTLTWEASCMYILNWIRKLPFFCYIAKKWQKYPFYSDWLTLMIGLVGESFELAHLWGFQNCFSSRRIIGVMCKKMIVVDLIWSDFTTSFDAGIKYIYQRVFVFHVFNLIRETFQYIRSTWLNKMID